MILVIYRKDDADINRTLADNLKAVSHQIDLGRTLSPVGIQIRTVDDELLDAFTAWTNADQLLFYRYPPSLRTSIEKKEPESLPLDDVLEIKLYWS